MKKWLKNQSYPQISVPMLLFSFYTSVFMFFRALKPTWIPGLRCVWWTNLGRTVDKFGANGQSMVDKFGANGGQIWGMVDKFGALFLLL